MTAQFTDSGGLSRFRRVAALPLSLAATLLCAYPAFASRRVTVAHAPLRVPVQRTAGTASRRAVAMTATSHVRGSLAKRATGPTRPLNQARAMLPLETRGHGAATASGRRLERLPSSRVTFAGNKYTGHATVPVAMLSRPAGPQRSLPANDINTNPGEQPDRSSEDRVRAWYRARAAAEASTGDGGAEASAPKPAPTRTARVALLPAGKPAISPSTAAMPDLSPVARKATVEDFDLARQKQAESIRSATLQNQSRTTADDDAAEAEVSHIPSTAPTAREALPFTHGDLLQAAPAAAAVSRFVPGQATLASTPAADPTKFNKRPDAVALADTTTPVPGTGSKPARVVAMQTATAPVPIVILSKPTPITRTAPAAVAIQAEARKPVLDPSVVQAMTDDAFDDAVADAPSARTAVALAGRTGRPAAMDAQETLSAELRGSATLPAGMFDDGGRLRMLPPMKGTHEILVHQNQMAVADGLDRIEDDNQLANMRRLKLIVALPDNDSIEVDERLPANRRYARPWSVKFLNDLAQAHYARFHTPLIITSAARTVAFQRRLILINGNAAPPTGDVASPHLYGQAIDLAKHGMGVTEIAWMRAYLTPVEAAGKIDVEEEFQQACFHISVYRRYLGLPTRKNPPAPDATPSRPALLQTKAAPPPQQRRHLPTALLATGLR